jgi:hypothetical protein
VGDGDNFIFGYVMYLPDSDSVSAMSDRSHQISAAENSATFPMCHTQMKPLSEVGILALHLKNRPLQFPSNC